MELSSADLRLLGAIRKRTRVARAVIAIFGIKGLLLAAAAVGFVIRAWSAPSVPAHDPWRPLELLVRQGNLSAAAVFGVHAILCLTICVFGRSQRKSDALTLKLIDGMSGSPVNRSRR